MNNPINIPIIPIDFLNVKVSLKNTLYKTVSNEIDTTLTALIYPGLGATKYP